MVSTLRGKADHYDQREAGRNIRVTHTLETLDLSYQYILSLWTHLMCIRRLLSEDRKKKDKDGVLDKLNF